MEFDNKENITFGHAQPNRGQSFFGGGDGDIWVNTFRQTESEASQGTSWCCCADDLKCKLCDSCNLPEMSGSNRMGIWGSEAECIAGGSIHQDTKLWDGTMVPQHSKCSAGGAIDPGGSTEEEEDRDPGDDGGFEDEGGTTGGSSSDSDEYGSSDEHSGGGYTAGGRSMDGLSHGSMWDQGGAITGSSYRCYYPDGSDCGVCVLCTTDEENGTATDALGNKFECILTEDQCKGTNACFCESDPTGYRCILKLVADPSNPPELMEVATCERVTGSYIEYDTLSQCQAQCAGFSKGDAGFICNNSISPTGGSSQSCEASDSGQYSSNLECMQNCREDHGL